MSGLRLLHAQRHLIGDGDAVGFEGYNFFGVIGEYANIFEPQIDQYLRADAAFVLHHALARGLAVELTARVKMNLRQSPRLAGLLDAKAAAGVVQVDKDAAI